MQILVPVKRRRTVLIVDRDAHYGRALTKLLEAQGNDVRLVTTAAQAQRAVRARRYDLAVVDLLQDGGGAELARTLSRRVGQLMLSIGARLERDELLEVALGFPVREKAALPKLLGGSVPNRGPATVMPMPRRRADEGRATRPSRRVAGSRG